MSITLRTGIVSVCYLCGACYRKVLKKILTQMQYESTHTNKILIRLAATSLKRR
jgi:hypothetical protein